MELRRTANAGVLLKLDGVSILMDGVCREVKPYPATPPEERARLEKSWPDVLAFTHTHKDHYDPGFAAAYQRAANGVILGSEDIRGAGQSQLRIRGVTVRVLPSRHIGAAGKTTPHVSFIVKGTKCVWFLGDSSPLQWKGRDDLPRPDVLIVPYAYANTPSGWAVTQQLDAQKVVLLHMPNREEDTIGLWGAVETAVGKPWPDHFCVPEMGETLQL